MLWKKVFIFILAAVAVVSCSKEENGYPDNSLQKWLLFVLIVLIATSLIHVFIIIYSFLNLQYDDLLL